MTWAAFTIAGMAVFAVGMVGWSNYRPAGLGLAAGGLVLLVSGVAMAPGWGS